VVTNSSQSLGAIYTPVEFASLLANCAIRNNGDKILDLGIGTGAFVYASYQRLLYLRANAVHAQSQLYGAEIDINVFAQFQSHASERELDFPNLHQANFFDIDFPEVDAVVGNPPYVRRTYIEDIDYIRSRISEKNPSINLAELPRSADLYIYFILYAISKLKPGGRLAIITADPWLTVGYGKMLKDELKKNFKIEKLITLDRRVFDNAQVKPI